METLYNNSGKYTLVIEYKDMKFFYDFSKNPAGANGIDRFIGQGLTEGPHLGTIISTEEAPAKVKKAVQKRIDFYEFLNKLKETP